MSEFDGLIGTAQGFLAQLAANNTKDWWAEHKPTYDADLKAPALALLDVVEADLAQLCGTGFKPKLYRAHRDVRFSKDKTPYHTHLHLQWTPQDADAGCGWFFGIGLDYAKVGWGWFQFSPTQMPKWREFAAGGGVSRLLDGTALAVTDEPELKRVPAPYAKNHEFGTDIRRKSFGLWADIQGQDLPGELMAHFKAAKPIHDTLTDVIGPASPATIGSPGR